MASAPFTVILHRISFDSHNRVEYFLDLPMAWRTKILQNLSKHILHDLLHHLPDLDLVETLEYMDPDEATDVLQNVPQSRQLKILEQLSYELKDNIEIFKEFDPQTAAGLMNLDYIRVEADDTVTNIARKFKIHEKRTGRLPAIIVVRVGKVIGYVPGHHLALSKGSETVENLARPVATIRHNASPEEVVRVFSDHPHNKVVVLGAGGNVLGVIYTDDVLRVIKDKAATSLYDFAGLDQEESVLDSTARKVHSRYRWLIINLATAFLAAFTVSLFDETISKFVVLAAYMPIVAGMGGNAATQTLAVLVRGIALRQIDLNTGWRTLKREVGAGLVNGIINGIIVAAVVLAFNKNLKLAIVLALAMVINLVVAGFFGTVVPLIMKSLKKDPATSATIFITTATDVLGFLAFLGIASLVL